MIGPCTLTGRVAYRDTYTQTRHIRVWPLFSARSFIRRKTLWCISFDAVCALVMQIPRRPDDRPALAAWVFRDTVAPSAFSAVREGWKFRIAKGALILICTSATAGRITSPPCITHGSRMEIDCITEEDGEKARKRKREEPK